MFHLLVMAILIKNVKKNIAFAIVIESYLIIEF